MNNKNDVFAAIENYIYNKIEWELFVLSGGTSHVMVIMKGVSRELMEQMDAEEINDSQSQIEVENDLASYTDTNVTSCRAIIYGNQKVKDLLANFGVKYPMFYLNGTSDDAMTNSLCIKYGQSVLLDYSHPEFFTHLDKVIAHVLMHDDLSGLSL